MTDPYPKTLDGQDLDSYCNTIDMALSELLEPISEWPNNNIADKAFDPATIPSAAQREGFELMRLLLSCAQALSGTLRYDVSVSHEKCEYHDQWMLNTIGRLKKHIANHGIKESA